MASGETKLKVAYLNFSNAGGMLHYVLNLAEAAAAHVDVAYVDVGYEPTADYAATGNPTLFVRWPSGGRVLNTLNKYRPRNFRALADRIVAELNPHVVHITSSSVGLLSLVKQLRRHSVTVVHTIHDPKRHDEKRTLWGSIYTRYQTLYQNRAAFRQCSLLHVHSPAHREKVLELYGPGIAAKTYVVAHGGGAPAALANGSAVPPELSALPPDGLKVLFFGRIEPYKGLDYLFRAHSALSVEHQRRCRLIVAGHGQLPESTPVPAGTLLINRFIRDDEIRSLLNACDVVVLPYTEGTQSGVIPLAYHFRRPVICTRVGALPEMIREGETGLLVEARNTAALAQAIATFLDTPALAEKMGSSGWRLLEDELSWRKIVQDHLAHYHGVSHVEATVRSGDLCPPTIIGDN
jgi:glycosyltransferase involved in cell wall biosynthesis